MTQIRITIPGKPAGKGRPRTTVRGGFVKVFTDAKTRLVEKNIAAEAVRVMAGRPPLAGPIRILIVSVFEPPESWPKKLRAAALEGRVPIMSKPDWDNLGKVTDALNGIVWTDDSHVQDGRSTKRYGAPARVEIIVAPWEVDDMVMPPGHRIADKSEADAALTPLERAIGAQTRQNKE